MSVKHRAAGFFSRRASQARSSRAALGRSLRLEALEDRRLLSVEPSGWHNAYRPADVNHDGYVTALDALMVVSDLRSSGSRALATANGAAAESAALQGASFTALKTSAAATSFSAATASSAASVAPSLALDVNNDGYVTAVDALTVVQDLRLGAQAVGDDVGITLQITDLVGNPITQIDRGQQFKLEVFVQDLRDPPEGQDTRGVAQAFVDVTFDDALVDADTNSLVHGANYDFLSGGSFGAGLIDEAGGTQDFSVGPQGSGKLLLFSTVFDAVAAGTVTFAADAADLLPDDAVLLYDPASITTNVNFGSASLTILQTPVTAIADTYTVGENSANNVFDVLANDEVQAGTKALDSAATPSAQGGTVAINAGKIEYTPKAGYHGADSFTYTMTDGLGHFATAKVSVSVNGVPVAADDPGPGDDGFSTFYNTVITTPSVLANDSDPDGDALAVQSIDTTTLATKGLVTDNGDGTFDYDPNGQFDNLSPGSSVQDKFLYTVSDGNGGTATAEVTITVRRAPEGLNHITGRVYADVSNDGILDAAERALGNVTIRLVGTDTLGDAVDRTTVTDALGQYEFADLLPGSYVLSESQPEFYLDGYDSVNGARYTGPNDQIIITPNSTPDELVVNFGERSLMPQYISRTDFINKPRQGIQFGLDAHGNMLWYSLYDGWDGVTSFGYDLLGNGRAAVTVFKGDASATFEISTNLKDGDLMLKGQTTAGAVYLLDGVLTDFVKDTDFSVADKVFAEIGSGLLNPFA